MTKANQSKIPRPLNCFMIFRLEKQSEIVARCPGANHRDISKIIAKWWREAPEQEKQAYRESARKAKMQHALMYPDYKYSPQKKTTGTRKYTIRSKVTLTSEGENSDSVMRHLYNDRNMLHVIPSKTSSPIATSSTAADSLGERSPMDVFQFDAKPEYQHAMPHLSTDMLGHNNMPPSSMPEHPTMNMFGGNTVQPTYLAQSTTDGLSTFQNPWFDVGYGYDCSLQHFDPQNFLPQYTMPTMLPTSNTYFHQPFTF